MTKRARNLEVLTASPQSDLVDLVIELSKKSQRTLGQLPFAAFHQAAAKGKLLVASSGGSLAGYVLFRVLKRNGIVMVTHLCVSDDFGQSGVARLLVDAVSDRHPLAPGIGLWCRKDYDATQVWPRLGFGSTGKRPARAKGRTLLHWWRPVNENTLFTFDPDQEDLPAAALDSNIFRDIHEPRSEFASSLALLDDWLVDVVEFVVTSQLETEILEAAEYVPSLVGTTSQYRRLSPSGQQVQMELKRLKPHVRSPDIKDKDERHLACAVAGGARFFVTRDRDVQAHASAIADLTGLLILSPEDLLLHLHAEQFESAYKPEAILETSAEIVPLDSMPSREELSAFVESTSGERARDLEQRFARVASGTGSGGFLWAIRGPEDGLLAIAAFDVRDGQLVVHALRVSKTVHQLTYARQLIHLIRQRTVEENCSEIEVRDADAEYAVDALVNEGFQQQSGHWFAKCETGIFGWDSPQLSDIREALSRPISDASLISETERRSWPVRFDTGRVPCYIVPIRPLWARALFDADPPQGNMFDRSMNLGLAREHVYYRSYRTSLEFPARLLWYVSGQGPNSGFRGVSWLDSVVSDRPRSLFRRFGAQGIYEEADVEACVKRPGGKATAMQFSRTEAFRKTVSLNQARKLWSPLEKTGALQSMVRIGEHVFYQLYREGQK